MSKRCRILSRSLIRDELPAGLAAISVALGLGSSAHANGTCGIDLQFIGDHSIPASQSIEGDAFGGISGIDYDPNSALWYLVTDDRSDRTPPRFFTATMHFDAQRVESVRLQARFRIPAAALDTESIRIDVKHRELLLAGEGDAARGFGPWLRRVSFTGAPLREISLPPLLRATPTAGSRPNRSIEGVTFDIEHRDLWIGLESPLLQDGPPADERRAADVRLTRLSLDGQISAQYVYRTDVASPTTEGETSDIGISEILAAGDRELLVLERSGVKLADGGFRFRTRLYCADLRRATDVSTMESLRNREYRRASKRLLFDFEHMPSRAAAADNIEGLAWGPDLGGGRRSLVFTSDNNFFPDVPTRLLFFSARPSPP